MVALRAIERIVENAMTTYCKSWNNLSVNEGYDYPMQFPWVTGSVALIGRFFYLSVAFRNHIVRVSWRAELKKRVYVKPVTAQTEMFGWLTLELNIIEAFRDDRKRYGLRVALLNWIKTVFAEEEYFDEAPDAGRH